jgi:UDP-N-acetylmuramoyl-L-alanyl-D-glutamate--2,6-diaminopimelate ligase
MRAEARSLKQLLAAWGSAVGGTQLPQPPAYDGPDVKVRGLVEHSDDVAPGACFVARVRAESDGHRYIGRAVERGASLILAQRPVAEVEVPPNSAAVYLQVPDTAETVAWLAAAWEGFPSRQLVMVGVTGTDGKTSTATLLFSILRNAGLQTGVLSTIKAVIGDEEEPLALHVTTPEAPVVQRHLRRMVDAGLTHCVLEATSHGLAQHRVAAVDFDFAVVTNITHEHLDYHGSYEEYLAAKARLFAWLADEPWRVESGNHFKRTLVRTAILNRDDSSYEPLRALLENFGTPHISYGLSLPANPDVYATEIEYNGQATRFALHFARGKEIKGIVGQPVTVHTPLVGEFNVYNMLAAAATAQAIGCSQEAIQRGLEAVEVIRGRMERVDRGQPFLVVVDFAHTPNALSEALAAARRMVAGDGRIVAVFGSAGKRDVDKRRLMAEVSARAADLTVLTAEDPRTESLDDILATMAEACRRKGGVEGQTFWRVADRGRAIYFALSLARPADLVLICGKGHEQSMCFGTMEYPWDDQEATIAALDAFLNNETMPDLGLPTFR